MNMFELSCAVGIICAIVCAIIASDRGRNTAGWLFCGLFLGVVGVVLVALLPSKK